ncbi:hypothetical protein PCAR4_280029 [Paraburkholderia caribensis]|nr:hypothetical protein PCAR4_280029 [Paraburkholderia caribensis]
MTVLSISRILDMLDKDGKNPFRQKGNDARANVRFVACRQKSVYSLNYDLLSRSYEVSDAGLRYLMRSPSQIIHSSES